MTTETGGGESEVCVYDMKRRGIAPVVEGGRGLRSSHRVAIGQHSFTVLSTFSSSSACHDFALDAEKMRGFGRGRN